MTGHTAETHREIRRLQKSNADSHHHPKEKLAQLKVLEHRIHGDILEVFGGDGNLTSFYAKQGRVLSMTRAKTGDSFRSIYGLRGQGLKFDVIDIDSYGYPDKFFPVVFEMMKKEATLIITFPVVGVNCLNGITEQHYITFWRSARPTIGDVVGILTDMALREWGLLSLIDVRKIRSIWRIAFAFKRIKSTEMCNVRNK